MLACNKFVQDKRKAVGFLGTAGTAAAKQEFRSICDQLEDDAPLREEYADWQLEERPQTAVVSAPAAEVVTYSFD